MKILNSNLILEDFFLKTKNGALLMFDFDGTLAPLSEDRKNVTLYKGVYEKLQNLMSLKNTSVAIVSGRKLSELEMLLGNLPVEIFGSHGLERKLVNDLKWHAELNAKLIDALNLALKSISEIDEKRIEKKPFSIAVHWRGLDDKQKNEIHDLVLDRWKTFCKDYGFEFLFFNGGIELKPKEINKGDAVKELLKNVPKDYAIAYFGDDLTDENAFAALNSSGLKVLVKEEYRTTLADIMLHPGEELNQFLDEWSIKAK